VVSHTKILQKKIKFVSSCNYVLSSQLITSCWGH